MPKHFVSAAVIVLNERGQLLLIKGPRRGWEPPGGQVELGESVALAAVREVKEETGIDIELIKFCGIFQNLRRDVINTLWLGSPVSGEIATSPESLEVGYFTLEQARAMVTWPTFVQRIEMVLDDASHPFCVSF
ncbi:MAG: NUDIX hydrolase [Firmicutes bacterium]|nr:NUDIX hydrolase [Bacillota bacterium]